MFLSDIAVTILSRAGPVYGSPSELDSFNTAFTIPLSFNGNG